MELLIQDLPSAQTLINAAKYLNITYTTYKISPFSEESFPKITAPHTAGIVFGGTTLQNLALKNKVFPAIFTNDNFTYSRMLENLSEHCLNSDSIIDSIGNVSITTPHFIRPNEDTKSFAGHVITPVELEEWKTSIASIPDYEYTTLRSSDLICVSPVKKLIEEYRFFIIDGYISTACLYSKYGKLYTSKDVPREVRDFAFEVIDTWIPHECCVLDVAVTNHGIKVIEFNGLNGAGLYEADIVKLLTDLQRYCE